MERMMQMIVVPVGLSGCDSDISYIGRKGEDDISPPQASGVNERGCGQKSLLCEKFSHKDSLLL